MSLKPAGQVADVFYPPRSGPGLPSYPSRVLRGLGMSMWSLTIFVQNPRTKDQPETISQPPSRSSRALPYDTPPLVGPNCPVADAGVPRAGSSPFSSQAQNLLCSCIFNWLP